MNLILSPHFDDAVLSLGGLLAKEGGDTMVATVFAGSPTIPVSTRWDKKCGFADSSEAMRARAQEDERALHALGVGKNMIRNFGYVETEYRAQTGTYPNLEESITKDIASLIEDFSSLPLIIFAPYLELHPDHKLVKDAALAAARGRADLRLYQDIPYIFKAKKTDAFFDFFRSKPAKQAILLSEADMEKKLSAVALYTSQIPHLGEHLLSDIKTFAASQARELTLDAPYCEAVYATKN